MILTRSWLPTMIWPHDTSSGCTNLVFLKLMAKFQLFSLVSKARKWLAGSLMSTMSFVNWRWIKFDWESGINSNVLKDHLETCGKELWGILSPRLWCPYWLGLLRVVTAYVQKYGCGNLAENKIKVERSCPLKTMCSKQRWTRPCLSVS